ncbi:uncharacterized protein TNCT_457411 [Trichonephila clavata]|uniref:Uncharacterized protein n=2 Tax=Trichonephila TaxID=2585208 RepID=A0A8X6HBS7_TRICU|nr:uncharacterized protein TNCT_457411 [Trichonephila clavata]GFY52752.1 uncharacterized protein TNIN_462591 [Trichonephila inaurata madagascariensis]
MATYTEFSELSGTDSNTTEDVLVGTSPGPPMFIAPLFKRPTSTLSPGHAAILEMHANSQSNAIIYVMVVLGLYVLGMSIVVIKYIRTERYEARLTRLFHNLVQRDHFFRLSRRRSSLPKCVPGLPTNIEDDLPLSPVIQIPDITSTIPTPDISDHMVEESKV